MNGYVCVSVKHYLQNQAANPMAVVRQPLAIEECFSNSRGEGRIFFLNVQSIEQQDFCKYNKNESLEKQNLKDRHTKYVFLN